jgi:HEPN domain-containing protein
MKKDKRTEARNWFSQAQAEFEDAQGLEERKRFYLALFLYQQAAEKA